MATMMEDELDFSWIFDHDQYDHGHDFVNNIVDTDLTWIFDTAHEQDNMEASQQSAQPSCTTKEPTKRKRAKKMGCRKKPGRLPVETKFPNTPTVLTDILQERGFEAQRSRAVPTGQSGLSLSECRDALLQNVEGLKEAFPKLSINTVQHMMEPPNKRNRASKLYRCKVAARIPKKKNTYLHEHENDHFYTARVKFVKEMITRIGKSAILISADNKAKVKIGSDTLATDRHQKIRRIYPVIDTPNYHQHDYPTPGYQATPCGYLLLPPKDDAQQILDEHGRLHYVHPPTGQSFVINRSPYNRVRVDAHISDLLPIVTGLVEEGTTILALLVDGGPDYNVNHLVNEIFYARLFRDTGLEALVVLSYCPGHSSLNDIERLWGTLTPPLVGVYLPDRLPGNCSLAMQVLYLTEWVVMATGHFHVQYYTTSEFDTGEDRPPIYQTIPAQEKEDKEHRVFNRAMTLLQNVFWKDLKHDGQPIAVSHVPSGEDTNHYGDYDEVHRVVSNGKSLTLLQNHPAIYEEYKYAITHIDRRLGMSVFLTCDNPACHPCVSRMPLRNPESVQVVREMPTPIPSPDPALRDAHFATYLEACELPVAAPCAHMPSVQRKGLGRCHLGCKYVFTSDADKRNHYTKMHPGRQGRRRGRRGR